MTHYTRGVAFERELIKILEAAGFSCIRGAGSKGQVFNEKVDIVATKGSPYQDKTAYICWIQCKVKKNNGKK